MIETTVISLRVPKKLLEYAYDNCQKRHEGNVNAYLRELIALGMGMPELALVNPEGKPRKVEVL